jgi:hypothetical protein
MQILVDTYGEGGGGVSSSSLCTIGTFVSSSSTSISTFGPASVETVVDFLVRFVTVRALGQSPLLRSHSSHFGLTGKHTV